MLYRKIEKQIRLHLKSHNEKILIVEGARQIGKSFIIQKIGIELFPNFIEVNLLEDKDGMGLFSNVRTTEDFYLQLSMMAGDKLGTSDNTLIFLDEIQAYPHLLTMLKFLRAEGKYTYIGSGSLLGLTLHRSLSVPMGSIEILKMYPLDFEEFLIANNIGSSVISKIYECFHTKTSPSMAIHTRLIDLFKKYLLAGGMPDAVNTYLDTHNIMAVRKVQEDIHRLYEVDASQYDTAHRLKIESIYRMIPSLMDSKKKRVRMKDIENKAGSRYSTYSEEFDYLVDSGIALEVKAVTDPRFPLIESGTKNLLKLYLNDVGILTGILFRNNIRPVLDDTCSVNLGAVYESVVAQELSAHGCSLFYYDNKKNGEVDYLVDDFSTLSVLPIEVKSGRDYTIHSAIDRFVSNPDYKVNEGIVFCNSHEVRQEGKIIYMPVYMVLCISPNNISPQDTFF